MWAYFDTSALVKRYVDEQGRREVLRLLRSYDVVTSAVAAVELRSALRRRVTERTVDADVLPAILKRIALEREFWAMMDVTREVLAAAETLVATHPIRSLGAVHIGSAQIFAKRIALRDLMFVTADGRQAAAADAVGLTIREIES